MRKFINCDVTAVLYEIMSHHTERYQDDFVIDKEMFMDAALSSDRKDKRLLWLSRPSGTVCENEYNTYISDTYEHNAWKFYGEQTNDTVKAYAVEIDGIRDGIIMGDLYELDYDKHYKQVKANALPIHTIILTYENGEKKVIPYEPNYYNSEVVSVKYAPRDLEGWNDILDEVQAERHNIRYIDWDLEKLKLEYSDSPTYSIYQLKETVGNLLFMSFDVLAKRDLQVDKNNYELVYIAERTENHSLDEIYEKFNLYHPSDFLGHSLSVSDIISINDDGMPRAYYVDSFGFQDVTDFFFTDGGQQKAYAQM